MQADLVLTGGRVFTGMPETPFADALAIAGGKVVALGKRSEIEALAGASTRKIDISGKLALAGFHDSHTHFLGAGLVAQELDLTGAKSPEEVAARVADRVKERPKEWVLGRGWDADLFPGGAWPHRRVLDAAAPQNPVFLVRRDGHAAWANTRALERAGVKATTADPEHGKILREGGEATGILLEAPAIDLVRRMVPVASLERRLEAVSRGLSLARSLGVTHIHDDASYDARLMPGEVYRVILDRGQLTARVILWQALGRPLDEIRAERDVMPGAFGVPRLSYGLLKGFLDGSLGSRTALLCDHYHDEPSASGMPLLEPSVLATRVREAHEAGFQVGLHAIGDKAVALALDAFAGLTPRKETGDGKRATVRRTRTTLKTARHRIEHAQILRPEDVARLGALGVVASVQPVHLANDMKIARARLGDERCKTSYCWRSLIDSGASLAFGTDYPVEPLDPLRGIYCAIARRSPDDRKAEPFHLEQRVTLEEALLAYTLGSAYAAHEERVLGRLAPGHEADVVVLSRDLFQISQDDIPDVRCEITVLGGEVVYERSHNG